MELGLSKYISNVKRIIIGEDWKNKTREEEFEMSDRLKKK